MAYEIPDLLVTFVAGADESSNQFCFMKLDSSGNVVITSGVTDKPIGVLQNAPTSGGGASVMLEGISKVIAGGDLAPGDLVGTDGSGHAVKYSPGTDTTKYIVGTALATAASGDITSIAIDCKAPHRAA